MEDVCIYTCSTMSRWGGCVRYLKKVTAINIHQSLCIQLYQLPEYCTDDMYTCAFIVLLVSSSVVGNDWSGGDMPCTHFTVYANLFIG